MMKITKALVLVFKINIIIILKQLFKLIFSRSNRGDLLIIKLGGIGDYILMRNFLYEIVDNINFKNKKITLIIDEESIELFNVLDKDTNIKCIGINVNKFIHNPMYFIKILIFCFKLNYKKLISINFSRFFYADLIAYYVNSKEKIAFAGLNKNQFYPYSSKWLVDNVYTNLITVGNNCRFDFLVNKVFFEKFLNKKLITQFKISEKFTFNRNIIQNVIQENEKYIVMVVGAKKEQCIWDIQNFIKLAALLYDTYKYKILIVGTKQEARKFNAFLNNVSDYIINDLGKTSLTDLINICYFSEFIVSNETGTAHLGASLKKDVFVISNGHGYGRFHPYPNEVSLNYHIIYLFDFDRFINHLDNIIVNDINAIKVIQVFEHIKRILK